MYLHVTLTTIFVSAPSRYFEDGDGADGLRCGTVFSTPRHLQDPGAGALHSISKTLCNASTPGSFRFPRVENTVPQHKASRNGRHEHHLPPFVSADDGDCDTIPSQLTLSFAREVEGLVPDLSSEAQSQVLGTDEEPSSVPTSLSSRPLP